MSTGLVDLHTHFFGPAFFRTLAAAAHPEGNPRPGFARLAAAGVEVPKGDARDHARRWLAEMDRHGIDHMVSFASIPEEAESVAEGVAASNGRLTTFSLIDPTAPGIVPRVRELTDTLGTRGLLLFPAMHRFNLSDPALDPFYREVESKRLPLIVHMGTLQVRVRDLLELPSDFDLNYATPERLVGVVERFPEIRFIIPHFGGGYLEETLSLGSQFANVAMDTSSSNSWIQRQPGDLTLTRVFARALEVFGAERIYFGTDSSVFPRGWRRDLYETQSAALDELGISRADRERILGGNTLALLEG